MNKSKVSLYLHVPFCSKICPYCAFYKKKWTKEEESAYLKALKAEIDHYAKTYPDLIIDTIFWGGGTPNLLRTATIAEIMGVLRAKFSFTKTPEITMEINPGLSAKPKLKAILDAGINRISVGVQSFNDNELKFLGRNHSSENAQKTLRNLRELGLKNLNIDLIFALPISTVESIQNSLDIALSYAPEHFSTYNLSIEPGTYFKRKNQSIATPEEDLKEYNLIIKTLSAKNYNHYEISNFAQKTKECRHNLAYWTFTPYIGLGPGAHSFFANRRYKHPKSLEKYTNNPLPKTNSLNLNLPLNLRPSLAGEYILTHLRLKHGLHIPTYNRRFNQNFHQKYLQELKDLHQKGLIIAPKTHLRPTKKGRYLLNEITLKFL